MLLIHTLKESFHFLSTMQEHNIRKFENREISREGDWREARGEGTEAVWVLEIYTRLITLWFKLLAKHIMVTIFISYARLATNSIVHKDSHTESTWNGFR